MSIEFTRKARLIGTLRAADGTGIVRIEDRFDTGIDDLWSALTEPARLAHWLGDVHGDLREGGDVHARFFASGWEGSCHVERCESPHRLLLRTSTPDEPDGVMEITLTTAGEQTILVFEDRGMPLEQIASYGAGNQIHVEDLAAYLAGQERNDAQVRWQELQQAYRELAVDPG